MKIFTSATYFFDSSLCRRSGQLCIALFAFIIVFSIQTAFDKTHETTWMKCLMASVFLSGFIIFCYGILELGWYMGSDSVFITTEYPWISLTLCSMCICTIIGGLAIIYFNHDIAESISQFVSGVPEFAIGFIRHVVTGH